MQQLDRYFQDRSADLLAHLRQTATLPELVQAATAQFNTIIGRDSAFAGELTPREQRLVTCFFNSVIMTLHLLGKIEVQVEKASVEGLSGEKSGMLGHTESVVATLASTMGAVLIPGLPPIRLAAGLVAGSLAIIAANQISGTKSSDADVPIQSEVTLCTLTIPPEEIYACLKEAVTQFDRLTGEMEAIRQAALQANLARPLQLEEIHNVLPFMHEMLGFQHSLTDLPKPLQDYLPILERILRGHGIEVVPYREGVSEDFFDRQSTFGEKLPAPRTLKPALVKGGKVLLKGLVMLSEP